MFGCVGRLVVLGLLVIAGGVAWFTRDRWLGISPPAPPASAVSEWRPITPAADTKAETQLRALGTGRGPAYVNVRAADLLAYAVSALRGILPPGASGVQARAAGDQVVVRGEVNIAEMGGSTVLGPIAGMLPSRDTLEVGGTIELLKPGVAQYRVKSIRVGELSIPAKLIPPIVERLRRGPRVEGLADDGVAIPLPRNIGDIRVKDGKITVYGAQP